MNSFHYNFQTSTIVNPLDKVKRFYINPYMIDGFKQLNLHVVIDNYDYKLVLNGNDVPVVVMDIAALKLNQVMVKFNSDGRGGTLTTKTNVIYFKFTDVDDIIRIDTVLCRL